MEIKQAKAILVEPVLFQFLDFRAYLEAYYHFRKSKLRGYSYHLMTRGCGIPGRNYIRPIIKGFRNLNTEYISGIAKYIGMNEQETKYFMNLVQWNQTEDADLKELYWKNMKKLIPKENFSVLSDFEQAILRKWGFLSIMEMIHLKDFRNDVDWIHQRLGRQIPVLEIDGIIKQLIMLGLLECKDGKLQKTKSTIFHQTGDIPSSVIQDFHLMNMAVGAKALKRTPAQKREYTTASVSIRDKDVAKFKAKIQEFVAELLAQAAEVGEEAEQVYQFNLQFFPITKGNDQ